MSDAEEIYPSLREKGASLCSLDELEERYWEDVAPDLRADGLAPETDRPTYRWLSKNGHRDLIYALKQYHGLSFSDFWADILELEPNEEGYEWDIDHEGTIQEVESYITQNSNWSAATADTHRQRLNRYVLAYYEVNGEADVLAPIRLESDMEPREAVNACWDAFDRLEDEGLSGATLNRIYGAVDAWYSYLLARRAIALNPADGLRDVRGWGQDDGTTSDPTALEADHVAALYDAAGRNRERMLVVALCAWGLRPNEVASLHRDQLCLEAENPYVEFETRKNGPGTVTVIYGAHDAQIRCSLLSGKNWNGYLFPSERSASGHIHRTTVVDWFEDLAETAGIVSIDGQTPTPKMGRRFWYNAYSKTLDDIIEFVERTGEEQGSSDPLVILDEYLSDERERELRRRFMESRLANAFGGFDS
jgi:site-specific recombinase XerD